VTSLAVARERYVSRFGDCEAKLAAASPGWLAPLRRSAIDRFAELGFPTRKSEAWKYTSLAAIADADLDPRPAPCAGVSRADLRALLGDDVSEQLALVFVDGCCAREPSPARSSGDGALITSLAGALGAQTDQVRPLLERADLLDRPFSALNGAFQRDGAFVRVTAGARPADPIQLLFVASPHAAGRVASPRNLIRVERGAKAAVSLRFASLCGDVYWTNAVTQIVLEEGAELDLIGLQSESDRAFHFSLVDVRQARDSRFRSHQVSLGGALARGEICVRLDAPGAECALNALFLALGEQHSDNQTTVEHARPHGTSRELYKGILGDRARGVFNGLVRVHPDAQRTSARQFNPNLLISDDAQINTKPTLEIGADDVQCSHGSTVGRLDDDALFYLRARGIDAAAARRMLTLAFASEIALGIPQPALRAQVERQITAKLERSPLGRSPLERSPLDRSPLGREAA
jgi:Fe-S cluster assembly protein SufD